MTTTSEARRRPAAGTNPDKEQHVDYRTTERLLQAVRDRHIVRDIEHEYVDQRTNRNVSVNLYTLEERGFVQLGYDGSITVTGRGEQWLARDRQPNRKPDATVTFQPPAVA